MLSILYYFIKISHFIGLIFCFFGFVIGLIKGHIIAIQTIKTYNLVSSQLGQFNINNYNFIVEYINQISYSTLLLGIIFYFIGIILLTVILIFILWNIFLFFNKKIK